MSTYAIGFQEIDRSDISGVGSKGANLGELSRIEGIQVPDGFCITTKAYKKITANNEQLTDLLDELSQFKTVDLESVGITSAEIRKLIENVCIPDDVTEEIESYLINFNEQEAFAIRSSSTAEDLPMASSAGQLDTYLNIIGKTNVLKHISKCWASLFTDRAVIYRIQNGFDHRKVQLSVVVQKMVFPQAAGILFTADPVSGNRKILSIDASFGLGETLVSGLVNADHYQVCNGRIIHKKISAKKLAIYALKDGGTESQALSAEVQNKQVLTDEQILQLEQLGRKIEEHFGQPQDIEWCLFNDTFYMVQSRPITTLYPIPETNDAENRVFISVGHQQMMTDAMKQLGLSLWQLRAARPMFGAGGRLFVDVTDNLATPVGRESLLDAMSQHDPLIKDALINITERGDFIKPLPDDGNGPVLVKSTKGLSAAAILAQIGNDPTIVADLIKHNQTSVETLKRNIQTKSGPALFDFILEDIEQSKKMIFDSQNMG
ncbi:PEP/pyruvate-binding domain-containing protein [Pedobacter sp. P26]|uniref:PEP/pyruvate-binding domain-containing protein n=1 Tax=Pedobacter sp. P26 TaxID=3423956 RepID=UPI003D6670FB